MTERHTEHQSEHDDSGMEELPVRELLGLELPCEDPLAKRVVSSIQRRETAGQLATLSWNGFGAVLMEVFRFGLDSRRPNPRPTRRPRE